MIYHQYISFHKQCSRSILFYMGKIYLLLDNIRSVHNVGSIFRTAECAGVSKIYCVGTTPVPIDRFGRKRKDFSKVSLGAEDMVNWEHLDESKVGAKIKQLKKMRFVVVAVEQTKNSVDWETFKKGFGSGSASNCKKVVEENLLENVEKSKVIPAKTKAVLYIFGNEVDGVSQKLLKLVDVAVEIPMKGKKESLNVAVTVGVVLFGTQ